MFLPFQADARDGRRAIHPAPCPAKLLTNTTHGYLITFLPTYRSLQLITGFLTIIRNRFFVTCEECRWNAPTGLAEVTLRDTIVH
jgi:hypothetical protein